MRFRFNLQTKIFFIVVSILILSQAISTAINLTFFRKSYTEAILSKSIALGNSLKGNIESVLDLGAFSLSELAGVEELMLEVISSNREINYISITDASGLVLFHTDRNEVGKVVDVPASGQSGVVTQIIRRFYDTAIPLFDYEGELTGFIRMGVFIDLISNRLRSIALDSITVLAVSLLITFELLIFFVFFGITGPIKDVTEAIGNIMASFDLTGKVEEKSYDEIGRLALRFNEFTETIRQVIGRLIIEVRETVQSSFNLAGSIDRSDALLKDILESAGRIKARLGRSLDLVREMVLGLKNVENSALLIELQSESATRDGLELAKRAGGNVGFLRQSLSEVKEIVSSNLEVFERAREDASKMADSLKTLVGSMEELRSRAGNLRAEGQEEYDVIERNMKGIISSCQSASREAEKVSRAFRAEAEKAAYIMRSESSIAGDVENGQSGAIKAYESMASTSSYIEALQRATAGLREIVSAADGSLAGHTDEVASALKRDLSEVNQLSSALQKEEQSVRGVAESFGLLRALTSGLQEMVSRFKVEGAQGEGIGARRLQPVVFIRPSLFLLIFSEALSVSFFPLFVKEIYQPLPFLSEAVAIGLPISIFMLFMGLSLPLAGVWSDRVGRKKPILAGAMATAAGLALTGISQGIFSLMAYRAFTALGYGVVFITCQAYISDNTTTENRASGMATFLAGFFSGSICGSAIGGMLADRIGYRPIFFIGAAIALLSGLLVYAFIADAPARRRQAPQVSLGSLAELLKDKDYLATVILQSIPIKIALTGFLYYSAPLYLRSLGNSQSDIGRIIIGYGMAMVFISPLVGRFTDRLKSRKPFIIIGGLAAGVAMLSFLFLKGTATTALTIALTGVAHSLAISPQISFITETKSARKVGTGVALGVFRFLERVGGTIGPPIAGILVASFSFPSAIATIGGVGLVGTSLFTLLVRERKAAN
jgi:predicted MFS family arabinose efflux permease/methyl-accepting chemotaxis protein